MRTPTRRNRNIGTAKQGHGHNNKLAISYPCLVAKSFFERLGKYEKVERIINGHTFVFVIEETRKNCRHACSISDIEQIIEHIPLVDYGQLKLIILRQPKKKEAIISPVWGRLIFSFEFEGDFFPAIIIEAVDYSKKLTWPKSQTPEDQKEFERLRTDGHQFLQNKRGFTAEFKVENVRNTQLYRTLLHEFGHYVQYLEIVERPGHQDGNFEEWERRNDGFFNITKVERETYAHHYAEKLLKNLIEEQVVSF